MCASGELRQSKWLTDRTEGAPRRKGKSSQWHSEKEMLRTDARRRDRLCTRQGRGSAMNGAPRRDTWPGTGVPCMIYGHSDTSRICAARVPQVNRSHIVLRNAPTTDTVQQVCGADKNASFLPPFTRVILAISQMMLLSIWTQRHTHHNIEHFQHSVGVSLPFLATSGNHVWPSTGVYSTA